MRFITLEEITGYITASLTLLEKMASIINFEKSTAKHLEFINSTEIPAKSQPISTVSHVRNSQRNLQHY